MGQIIIYDFDGTLTPYSLPKFEILERSGMKDGAYNPKFLDLSQEKCKEKNIDLYTAMYETYFEIIKNAGFKLTDENFCLGHEDIELNLGVTKFLEMLNKNNITNYLLSSGVKVFLERISISPLFKEIYATSFLYNQDLEAVGFEYLMTDKNKVSAIKDILKKSNIKDEDCSNIIYIGDGFTDYFAMKYVKENGGTTIFVCNEFNSKDLQNIKEKNVVDYFTISDFSRNSELYNLIKHLCEIK